MKFSIEGKVYEWSGKFTLTDAFFLKEKAHLTVLQFGPAIEHGDPHAVGVLVYLAKRRAGEAVRWEDLGELEITSFDLVPEEEVEENPTGTTVEESPSSKPDGRTRKRATSAT